jgi:uncharacterized protein (TIGR02246 family)
VRRLAISVIILLFGGTAGAQPRHGRFGSPEEQDIRQAVDSMNSFWNRGDARNYATALSDDTDWENAAGWRIRGRSGVERYLGEYLWNQNARPMFRTTGERVRMLAPDLAVVEQQADASSTVNPDGRPVRVREMQFFQKRSGRWQVISTRIWEPREGPPPPRMPEVSAQPFAR